MKFNKKDLICIILFLENRELITLNFPIDECIKNVDEIVDYVEVMRQ